MDIEEIRRRQLRRLIDNRFDRKISNLASAIDRQGGYLSRVLSGKKGFGEDFARYIESTIGLTPGYFDHNDNIDTDTPHEDDYTLVQQFHVNGSCGNGYMNDHVEIRGGLAFKRDWMARMKIDPAQASVIYARGDSMAPNMNDGDVMLIDGRKSDPQSGKVYVIEVDGDLRVKRMFRRPAGWVIVSDNQDKARYPDEPLSSLGDIRILGQVVWRGGGM